MKFIISLLVCSSFFITDLFAHSKGNSIVRLYLHPDTIVAKVDVNVGDMYAIIPNIDSILQWPEQKKYVEFKRLWAAYIKDHVILNTYWQNQPAAKILYWYNDSTVKDTNLEFKDLDQTNVITELHWPRHPDFKKNLELTVILYFGLDLGEAPLSRVQCFWNDSVVKEAFIGLNDRFLINTDSANMEKLYLERNKKAEIVYVNKTMAFNAGIDIWANRTIAGLFIIMSIVFLNKSLKFKLLLSITFWLLSASLIWLFQFLEYYPPFYVNTVTLAMLVILALLNMIKLKTNNLSFLLFAICTIGFVMTIIYQYQTWAGMVGSLIDFTWYFVLGIFCLQVISLLAGIGLFYVLAGVLNRTSYKFKFLKIFQMLIALASLYLIALDLIF